MFYLFIILIVGETMEYGYIKWETEHIIFKINAGNLTRKSETNKSQWLIKKIILPNEITLTEGIKKQ